MCRIRFVVQSHINETINNMTNQTNYCDYLYYYRLYLEHRENIILGNKSND